MLAYILALTVGFGSFALYMAAFFLPEVHRKYDFIWSGVGLFYALVLWVCAGRITGGVLLGQTASVALLGWFGWQTLTLRRELTPPSLQTQPSDATINWVKTLTTQIKALQTKLTQRFPSGSFPFRFTKVIELATTMQDLLRGFQATVLKPKPKKVPIDIPPRPHRASAAVTQGAAAIATAPAELPPEDDFDDFDEPPTLTSLAATESSNPIPDDIPALLQPEEEVQLPVAEPLVMEKEELASPDGTSTEEPAADELPTQVVAAPPEEEVSH